MIQRSLMPHLQQRLKKGKAVILTGPRQVGKTTLLRAIQQQYEGKTIWLNCDEPDVRQQLTNATSTEIKALLGNADLVLIDEAQRVKNIGLTLKLLVDNLLERQVIVTGSSALELANEIQEPLTGRKFDFHLYPLSVEELVNYSGALEEKRLLERRLIYGQYPEVVLNQGEEDILLRNICDSYLYKDIFTYQDVRKAEVIQALLEALALQVGSEVSYQELAQLLKIDQATVVRYIDLLEKAFVVFRLRALNRNVRNEIAKIRKIYFYDNGIRNALIKNYQPLNLRADTGALWENFLVSERFKSLHYAQKQVNSFFWRTAQQQEIDYVEEENGQFKAYEFKWNPLQKAKFSRTFTENYPVLSTAVINSANYLEFVLR
ncbi:ATPase [Runella rosea]|uniref:ATPase n=1 Tax=Runella rosea TaxID=2259595 RepID=A0A344THL8_9BACT|nr:ATP-binding protein [Runella rosea]AXE18139.1 ATPase [Runella rosea]